MRKLFIVTLLLVASMTARGAVLITKGATSQSVTIHLVNSTSGQGLTGLTYSSSGLIAYYVRSGAAPAAISLVTQTPTGAYSSGGFCELDSTHCPGDYRLDIPDAALATGSNGVRICLSGATNLLSYSMRIQLLAFDIQTALGSQTVGSVTGAVGSVTGAVGSVTAGVTLASSQHVIVDSGTVTSLTNLPAITAGWLTASGIAAGALNGKGDWLLASGYTAPDNTNIVNTYNIVNSGTYGNSAIKTAISALPTPIPTPDIGAALTAYGAAKTSDIPTVAQILSGVVDGTVDLKTALMRLMAAVVNSAPLKNRTIYLMRADNATTIGTQAISPSGTGRATTWQ